MFRMRKLGLLFALAIAITPAVSEASFARKIGSRYGGKLSSNKSIRTQQLTADPVSVLRGSTSTTYDPNVVSLSDVYSLPGFDITNIFVEVSFGERGPSLISFGEFKETNFPQTGYLQVFYQASTYYEESSSAFLMGEPQGNVVVDTDGETEGDDTHEMIFDYIAEDENTIAKYRLYADDGSRGEGPDSLVSFEDPNFVIRDIEEANVAGALIPLPAAFGPALIGFAGIGLVKRLRRRLLA